MPAVAQAGSKVVSMADAVAHVQPGMTVMIGGFMGCGNPHGLIAAMCDAELTDLTLIATDTSRPGYGIAKLVEQRRLRKLYASHVGLNPAVAAQMNAGELEVELVPQGTLAERLRAGGCGIPAFYTPAGVGTPVAAGGLPWRHNPDGSVAKASPAKETRRFGDRDYVLEEAIRCDYALVRASIGDREGNLYFSKATRNFNPLCAMAGRITIAEVERLVEPGEIEPEDVHVPGIFVARIVEVGAEGKRIERVTTRKREGR